MTLNIAYYKLKGLVEFLEEIIEEEGKDAKVYCSVMKNALNKVIDELNEK